MIINRIENDEVITGLYDSSNVLLSEYNKTEKKLTITFGYGGKYSYLDVSLTDFTRFENADSQGKVLNSHIKPTYSFEKLDDGDVKVIKESIKKTYKDEIETFKESIIKQMGQLIADSKPNVNLHMVQLNSLTKTIKIYIDKINNLK